MSNILKNKILGLLKDVFDEWLLGFNSDDDFKIGVLSQEKLNLKNAIINVQKVNEVLAQANMPYKMKAGIIGKLSLKSSMWNLFSDSINIELADVHFIFGPSRDMMSNPDSNFH